jgi:glycosyltransferase involved in cell wall biosynthesis
MQALIGGGATGLGSYARGILYAMERLTKGESPLPDLRRDLPNTIAERIARISGWPKGIEIVRLYPNRTERPLSSVLKRLQWEQFGIIKAAEDENIDVIYCPALGSPLKSAFPKVTVVHDLIPLHSKSHALKLADLYFVRYLPRCYSSSQASVFHTETVRAEFQGMFPKYPSAHTFVVPAFPAVTVPLLYPPTSGGGWYLPPGVESLESVPLLFGKRSGFLCLATFEERKNLGLALDAYAMLEKTVREKHQLILVGKGGDEREYFWQLVEEAGLARFVKLTGYVPLQTLIKHLRTALALLFPSTDEGFGMPPLEAMALGTPAIVGDAPALQEVYGGVCPAVGRDDAAILAAEMARLANHAEHWNKLSAKGLAFSKQFTPERSAVVSLAAMWIAGKG